MRKYDVLRIFGGSVGGGAVGRGLGELGYRVAEYRVKEIPGLGEIDFWTALKTGNWETWIFHNSSDAMIAATLLGAAAGAFLTYYHMKKDGSSETSSN